MKRTKKPVIPGKMTRVRIDTLEGRAQLAELAAARGWRPAPEQELAEYFERVDSLCGKSPEPGTALAEIREACDALRRAMGTGNMHLVAVRALELGEYRFWPGAVKHDAQTGKGRGNLAASNAGRKDAADKLVVEAFGRWQRKARGVLRDKGIAKTARKRAELFAKYSTWRPRSTERRRLFRLADEGKLPDLPV